MLSPLDFAVIAVYFAVVLGAGLFMGKYVKSTSDFFSGGKRVPWWMGAISSYMAMISCFVFIAYAQIGYEDGLVGVTVFWSTAFAILAGTFVFARRWQRANLATPIEYLERRYGPGVRQGETCSNATEAVEWVVPRTVMTQLVIANEGLK